MKAPVNGIRKPLISTDLFKLLEECLRFRHLVRNSYGIFLDPAQTRLVSIVVKKAYRLLKKEMSAFIASF